MKVNKDIRKKLVSVLNALGIKDAQLVQNGQLINPQRRLIKNIMSKSYESQKLSIKMLEADLAAQSEKRASDNELLENS